MTRPLRLLYTIPNFITAGSGRVVANLATNLDRTLVEPTVAVRRLGGALEESLRASGVTVLEADYTVPLHPLITLPRRLMRAARPFRPYAFDAWHSFDWRSDPTEPLVARAAGARTWIYTKTNMGWTPRASLVRSALASRIVALNSDMMSTFFDRPWIRRRVVQLPLGVDAAKFLEPPRSDGGLRAALGIDRRAPLVGCVANLIPIKAQDVLLRAVADNPGMHVVLAGAPFDATFISELTALSNELGVSDRVHRLGRVDDVAGLLHEIDVFALVSNHPGEGLPAAVVEAMAAGVPCVVSDVPGLRDLVRHEHTGLVVPPRDHSALARELERVVSTPQLAERLATNARQVTLPKHALAAMISAHEDLYRCLPKRRARPTAWTRTVTVP